MTDNEYEHMFGWMRRNPTWAKEFAAIEQMRAEIKLLEIGVDALRVEVAECKTTMIEARAKMDVAHVDLAVVTGERDRLRAEVSRKQQLLDDAEAVLRRQREERLRLRKLLRFSMRFWPDHGSFFHNRIIGEHLRCEVCKTKIAIEATLKEKP